MKKERQKHCGNNVFFRMLFWHWVSRPSAKLSGTERVLGKRPSKTQTHPILSARVGLMAVRNLTFTQIFLSVPSPSDTFVCNARWIDTVNTAGTSV